MRVMLADIEKAVQTTGRFAGELVTATIEATEHELEFILSLTQDEVPIGPTGQLRLSGRVEPPELTSGEVVGSVAYGGPAGSGRNTMDVDYAVVVHEDLEMPHQFGKAKYVEDPARAEWESGRALARMDAEIAARMGV